MITGIFDARISNASHTKVEAQRSVRIRETTPEFHAMRMPEIRAANFGFANRARPKILLRACR
jgi:hypothetical protein